MARGGGGVDDVDDVDVGEGGGGEGPERSLTSHGATSRHSLQSAVSEPGAQCDHYRHSQLQLTTHSPAVPPLTASNINL